MSGVTRVLGSVRSFVAGSLLLSPTLAFGADATRVQQIGELFGEVAEAVAAEVNVVPFSPDIDARTTPIIVAPGEAFVQQGRPGQVGGLSGAERKAIRQAYAAGQTILLLHASVHDIEALHVLVKGGVTHQSSSDPAVLAYTLRQEHNIPTVRIVHNVRPSLPAPVPLDPEADEQAAEEAQDRALQQALDIVISDLTRPPVLDAPADDDSPTNWTALQTAIITSTSHGVYNTPVSLYALHACRDNKDYYLVETGGDWTATEAAFSAASQRAGQIQINPNNDPNAPLIIEFQPGKQWCTAGISVTGNQNEYVCRYLPYPLYYEVDIVPPNGPTVIQFNASPAGDQGVSADYSSGVSFSITGEVSISGVIQPSVSWNNETTVTVPPIMVAAGIPSGSNEGRFTRYQYCTVGSTISDCASNIQITGQAGACQNYIVGDPQQGQTPNGSLSDVAQTVRWQVDPATYGNSETFDVQVTWQVNMAVSQALLYNGQFIDRNANRRGPPTGNCNFFGCSCSVPFASNIDVHSQTFNLPIPSSSNCPSG